MSKKKKVDWERVELDYRAGLLSLRELASKHDVSLGAITRRAARDGWCRDLADKVRARVDQLIGAKENSGENTKENTETNEKPTEIQGVTTKENKKENAKENTRIDLLERSLIESTAEAIVHVKLSHRSSITRYRTLITSLLLELEQQTGNAELFDQLAELMESPDDKGNDRLNDMYMKVIALPSRIDSVKKLSETLKILIGLERDAFDIAPPVKVEHTGKGGGPIQHETVDLSKLSDAAIAELMNARPED